MVTSWAITECTPEGTEQVYSNWTPRSNKYFPEATDQVSIEEEKEGCLETVFEDGILKKEYSLEEIRQRIDHGL